MVYFRWNIISNNGSQVFKLINFLYISIVMELNKKMQICVDFFFYFENRIRIHPLSLPFILAFFKNRIKTYWQMVLLYPVVLEERGCFV
jgi:hypothetical protein